MKKSLVRMMVGLLSVNMVLAQASSLVLATDDDNAVSEVVDGDVPADPPATNNPDGGQGTTPDNSNSGSENDGTNPDPGNTDSKDQDSENPDNKDSENNTPNPPEESSNDNSDGDKDKDKDEDKDKDKEDDKEKDTTPAPETTPRPPRPQPPVYQVPNPSYQQRVDVPTAPVEEPVQEVSSNEELLTYLLEESLGNPNFDKVWEVYRALHTEFELGDLADANKGSIYEDMYAYLEELGEPEAIESGEDAFRFIYTVDNEIDPAAYLVLDFNAQGHWVGAGLSQGESTETEGQVHPAFLSRLADRPVSDLLRQDIMVESFYQIKVEDTIYTSVLMPSEMEDHPHELIVLDQDVIRSHESISEETVTRYSFNQVAVERLRVYLSSITDFVETTFAEETTNAEVESDPEAQEFLAKYALEGDYDPEKLVDVEDVMNNYAKLTALVEEGEKVTGAQVEEIIGEPTEFQEAGEYKWYQYYGYSNKKVILLEITVSQNDDQLVSIRLENRTPELDGEFGIQVDEIGELANRGLTALNLINSLKEPSIVEHQYQGDILQVRYLWTRLGDPAIRNIEFLDYLGEQQPELFYYEANQAQADETTQEDE